MSSVPKPVLLRALQSNDQRERLEALKTLKNDIVGHAQKKERWVEAGILEPIGKIINTSRHVTGNHPSASALSVDEDSRLQTLQILSSFAKGGFAFLKPLYAVGALSGILSSIPPSENQQQVVIAALRAALSIGEAMFLAPDVSEHSSLADSILSEHFSLADLIFVPSLLSAFRDILSGPVTTHHIQTQRNLVAKLVSLLCTEDRHQQKLADSGILEALATNLASVIVARGFAIPGAEAAARQDGILDSFPAAATPGTDTTAILEALSSIIGDSKWRACALVHSPAMLAIFPSLGLLRGHNAVTACADAFKATGLQGRNDTQRQLGVMDSFVPVVPEVHQPPAATNPFSSLAPTSSKGTPSSIWNETSFNWDPLQISHGSTAQVDEDFESPLIPWLLHTARLAHGMERLVAASLATILFKAGYSHPSRESYMGRLIVPLLLQGLDDSITIWNNGEASLDETETSTIRYIVERSLEVLAKLVVDSEFLQKCAFDCSAVKIISVFLKGAYEPVTTKLARPWSPTPQNEKNGGGTTGVSAVRMGPSGQVPLLAHRIRVREAALKAVAAVAGREGIPKAFVDQDLVPYIVESVFAYPSKPTKDGQKSPRIRLGREDVTDLEAAYGSNPVSVIIAACHALRVLSRATGILRTTLQDCGIASPVFRLLQHADVEVKIAASSLICNLVTYISPMRLQLDNVGVMRVLCDQTRSQDPILRINALWALRHWAMEASLNAKKECLEELTPGWLIQLIHEDKEDDALYQRTTRSGKQAASDNEDVEMVQPGEANRTSIRALLQTPATTQPPQTFSRATREAVERSSAATDPTVVPPRSARLRQAEEKITEARETELDPVRKVRDHDLGIQEQGLKFLQNLIGPIDSSPPTHAKEHTEMIEHLFTVLDSSRVFEILESKLRPKFLHPFGRRHSSSSTQDSRVLYPQACILEPVIYILVHLAASVPKHRQILTSQDKLMASLTRHFISKDRRVRVALCHLMVNLTWADGEDESQCRDRTGELKRLGLLGKLESLQNDDPDLNVRERAKAAVFQMRKGHRF